ncbi:Testicular haploid expressed gene protein [Camelus dromedarius]|uniref:Testicular haploid expressed gene protein n=1 Tax=Camelus dromedarius TaxID=9838 RepID=A0A5N4CLW4_CAMDR|nr:Testicular haploid expressed gene protein [Camelus dromedarius]
MGDHQQSSPYGHHTSEPKDRSERVQEDATLGLQGTVYESWGSRDAKYQDLDDRELGSESQEEEIPPEVTGEELLDSQHPAEAIAELERVLEKDEEGVPEMSRLSISQRLPSTSVGRERRKRRRLFELAKPKTNWHVLKDRMGCCCRGYAWITPRMRSLQFCVYWPSVYWTERFLKDTTLTITVPEVSRRVEELARPKRFYSECYSNNRTTSVWPIARSTLGYQASSRLRELARPKMRSNIWSTSMSEVSQVSRAARMAVPSPRILLLAKPRAPATLLEEWDPMPKPKPHVSDYNRLLHLAMPKAQSDKCVPDRDPRWEVLEITKKAVASPRVISLAKPKVRKCLNEGYDPCRISPASLVARASPRLHELATPKGVTGRV